MMGGKDYPKKVKEGVKKRNSYPPCVILGESAVGSVTGMVRSIGSRGVPVYVLLIADNDRYASICARSRYCRAAITIPYNSDPEVISHNVLEWVHGLNFHLKPALFPVTDKACTYIAKCRSMMDKEFDICMANNDVIFSMLDKPKANNLVRKCGLEVPEDGYARTQDELEKLIKKMKVPAIVKPTWWYEQGKNHFKAKRCDTKEQLLEVGGKLIHNGAIILVQEYISGSDETVEVYMFYRSRDGRTIHGCTGTKIRQIPPGAGSMASGRAVWLPHVAKMSNAFLKQIDYRGLGGIEYKRYNGKSYFIEMSIRPEGFHTLAIKAGVDLPWYAYSDIALNSMPREHISQREAYYIKGSAYLALWRHYWQSVPVIREAMELLCTGKTQYDLWCLRDAQPWFTWISGMIKIFIAKIFRHIRFL